MNDGPKSLNYYYRVALPLIWLGGDLYKLSYYTATNSPIALQLCAAFQIFTDLCILAQFGYYKNSTQKVGDTDVKEKFN